MTFFDSWKRLRLFGLLLLLSVVLNNTRAQPPIIPLAPTTAGLGQSIETPIGLYTGTATIDIPIYTIETGSFKLPISLSYRSGGIKVADVASWVGLGWNVNAGGVITRGVVGLPDETPGIGYFNSAIPQTLACVGNLYHDDTTTSSNLCQQIMRSQIDASPDNFYFSSPAGSGRIFTKPGEFQAIPKQNLRFGMNMSSVTFSVPGAPDTVQACIGSWTITDGMQNVYTFANMEKSNTVISTYTQGVGVPWGLISRSDTTINSVGSWYLTSIVTPYRDTIRFNYDTVVLSYDHPISTTMTSRVSGSGLDYFSGTSETIQRQIIVTQRLSSIVFLDGSVKFIATQSGRADLIGDKALDRVVVENVKGDTVKQFCLSYDYLVANENPSLSHNVTRAYDSVSVATGENNYYNDLSAPPSFYRRLLLRGIVEKDKDGVAKDAGIRFEYEKGYGLKKRDDNAVDYWGYANGYSGTSIAEVSSGSFDYVSGAKEPDAYYGKQGSLRKIVYPTGGSVAYDYEQNYAAFPAASPGGSGSEIAAGGLRVANMIFADSLLPGGGFAKSYAYSDGAVSALPYYKNSYSARINGNDQIITVLNGNSIYPLTTTQGSYVGYGHVEEFLSGNGLSSSPKKGKTVYYYSNPTINPDSAFVHYEYGTSNLRIIPNHPVDSRDWQRGLLLEQRVYEYDSVNHTNSILKKRTKNTFSLIPDPALLYCVQAVFESVNVVYDTVTRSYTFLPYHQSTGKVELDEIAETIYDDRGDSVVKTTFYTYNQQNYLPSVVRNYESGFAGQEMRRYTWYEADVKHVSDITDRPVEIIQLRYGPGGNNVISGEVVSYGVAEEKKYTLTKDKPISDLDHFDLAYLNINNDLAIDDRYKVEVREKKGRSNSTLEREYADGTKEVYLWGYARTGNKYAVAKILGADYLSAAQIVNQEILDNAAYFSDAVVRAELDKLRDGLPNAHVSTYTYKPLVGMTSETDPNGRSLFYKYDSFGRLVQIRDRNNKILRSISYTPQGQVENPESYAYVNVRKSQSFTRTNCRTTTNGGTVAYVVEAGTYTSAVSQADADQQAQDEIDAYGQMFANMAGSCPLYYSEQRSGDFTKNSCSLGQNPIGKVTYTVAADTYTSTESQWHANRQAELDVETNGQSYANLNGECGSPYSRIELRNIYYDWFTGTTYADVYAAFYKDEHYTIPVDVILPGIYIQGTKYVVYDDSSFSQVYLDTYTDGSVPQLLLSGVPILGFDPVEGKVVVEFYAFGGLVFE